MVAPVSLLPAEKGRQTDFWLLVGAWCACTVGLFCLRPGYLFPPFDVIDSWVYSGYQWDLAAQIREFGPTYYGSRLSIILPGVAAHAILPPLAANLAVKLLGSALLTLCLASMAYHIAGIRAGLLAVTGSVLAPQVIYALHTDYMDGPVVIYAALTLTGISFARYSRYWYAWTGLAGVGFTGMAIANLSAPATVGLGLAVYHLVWLRWSVGKHVTAVLVYALSGAGVLAILGAIHVRFGGGFNFLQPQLAMLFHLKGMGTTPWTPPNWHWLTRASWLVLPVAALIWGLFRSWGTSLAANKPAKEMIKGLTLALAIALSAALYVESTGNGVLAYDFYASFYLCFALPLLALCCATDQETQTSHLAWPLGAMAVLLGLITFWDTQEIAFHLLQYLPWLKADETMPALVLVLGALALAVWGADQVFGARWRGGAPRSLVFLLTLLVLSMRSQFHALAISDHLRERYSAVHTSFMELSHRFPPDSYRFWTHPDQSASMALCSSKLWGYRLWTPQPFPFLDQEQSPERTVIVTAPAGSGPQVLKQVAHALIKHRLGMSRERIISIPGEAGAGIDLVCFTCIEIATDPGQPQPGVSPGRQLLELSHEPGGLFEPALAVNTYGQAAGAALREDPKGWVTYARTDPRDHLATAFVQLDANEITKTRDLSLIVQMPTEGHVIVVLQTDAYHDLKSIPLTQAGRSVHRISIPAGVKAFRLYFMCDSEKPTALPTRVTVFENALAP